MPMPGMVGAPTVADAVGVGRALDDAVDHRRPPHDRPLHDHMTHDAANHRPLDDHVASDGTLDDHRARAPLRLCRSGGGQGAAEGGSGDGNPGFLETGQHADHSLIGAY